MLSMISENTELPNISPISFFESSGSNSEELLLNANFANVPRNNYGRPVLAVPPIRAERLSRQRLSQPDTGNNNLPAFTQKNGPIRPVPIAPVVIPQEIPQPNYARMYNGERILQTPVINQYNMPAAQFQLPNPATLDIAQIPYNLNAETLLPNGPGTVAYYYNAEGSCILTPREHIATWKRPMWVLYTVTALVSNKETLHEGNLTLRLCHTCKETVIGVAGLTMKSP